MPNIASNVAQLANDVLASIDLAETIDNEQVGAGHVHAQARVALDDLVTLARAYSMVAYVEQVNGRYRYPLPTEEEIADAFTPPDPFSRKV